MEEQILAHGLLVVDFRLKRSSVGVRRLLQVGTLVVGELLDVEHGRLYRHLRLFFI